MRGKRPRQKEVTATLVPNAARERYIFFFPPRSSFKFTFPLNLTGWWLKHKQETFDEPRSPSRLVGWLLRGAGGSRLKYDLAQTLTQTLTYLCRVLSSKSSEKAPLKQMKESLPGRGKYFHMFEELSFNAELKQQITFCLPQLPL